MPSSSKRRFMRRLNSRPTFHCSPARTFERALISTEDFAELVDARDLERLEHQPAVGPLAAELGVELAQHVHHPVRHPPCMSTATSNTAKENSFVMLVTTSIEL